VITVVRPVIKLVGSTNLNYVGVQRVCSAESASLSGVQRIGLAVAGRFASALAGADDGVGAVFTSLYPIVSRLSNRKRQVRGIDLEDIVLVQPPHSNVKGA
jgi:hypothetical protein